MDTVIGILVVVLVAIGIMSIMIGALVITAKEIASTIKGINLDKDADEKVKFIGPTTTHFGRAPAPRKNNMPKNRGKTFIGPKNRKNWGIH